MVTLSGCQPDYHFDAELLLCPQAAIPRLSDVKGRGIFMGKHSVEESEVHDGGTPCSHCGAPSNWSSMLTGSGFEWKTRAKLFRIPLIHVAFGRDAQGKIRVAKGFIAVGQFAVGAITVAQFGIGILFGLGQITFGLFAVGQIALGLFFGLGQFATGLVTIGQFVVGLYGFAQAGWVRYLWSPERVDMEAVALYYTIQMRLRELLGL
ncbi:hypothetical protein ACFL2Q_08870 [Thermodesulfobacteriota bacterium]